MSRPDWAEHSEILAVHVLCISSGLAPAVIFVYPHRPNVIILRSKFGLWKRVRHLLDFQGCSTIWRFNFEETSLVCLVKIPIICAVHILNCVPTVCNKQEGVYPCMSATVLFCNFRGTHCSCTLPHLTNGYMWCLFYSSSQTKAAHISRFLLRPYYTVPLEKKKRRLHGVRRPRDHSNPSPWLCLCTSI